MLVGRRNGDTRRIADNLAQHVCERLRSSVVEHRSCKAKVVGSIPTGGSTLSERSFPVVDDTF